MARIEGVDPDQADDRTKAVFAAQTKRWGQPLVNHLVYARRPSIHRGARVVWGGLDESGLLPTALHAIVNRRVASLVGCVF